MTFESIINWFPRMWGVVWENFPDIFNWFSQELNQTQQASFGVQYRFELILGAGLIVILGAILVKWVIDFIP